MTDRFYACHTITAVHEGGWSDHKADPGGKTMYGITEAVYHAWLKARGQASKPVRNISLSEAQTIYREQYWNPTAVKYNLFPGVDLAVYDASVNSGVSRGLKWLKAAAGSNNHSATVKRICRARLSFVQSLGTWKTFGKGWGRRIADIEAKGVVMALQAMGTGAKGVEVALLVEVNSSLKSVKNNNVAAKASGAGAAASAGTPVAVDAAMDTTGLLVLGAAFLVLVGVTAWLVLRQKAAQERANAYAGALVG